MREWIVRVPKGEGEGEMGGRGERGRRRRGKGVWIMVLEREVRSTEGRRVVVVVSSLGSGMVRRLCEIEENLMVVGEWEGTLGGVCDGGRGGSGGVEEEDGLETFGIRRLWSEDDSIALCDVAEGVVAEVAAAAALDAVPNFLKANLRFGSKLARVSSRFCRRDLSAFFFFKNE